jgi:hypothetical protein
MSYTGRDVLQAAAGITKQDFDIISWLTGVWAIVGYTPVQPKTTQHNK